MNAHDQAEDRARASAFAAAGRPARSGTLFFIAAPVAAILAVSAIIPAVSVSFAEAVGIGRVAHGSLALSGHAGAVVAAFLLTAIPRWTASPPPPATLVIVMLIAWSSARFSDLGAGLSPMMGASSDLIWMFGLLIWASGRVITAGTWKVLRVLACLAILAVARAGMIVAPDIIGDPQIWQRLAIAGYVGMIMIVGGRIVPGFTRSRLQQSGAQDLPIWFNRYDALSLFVAGTALAFWITAPGHAGVVIWFLAAGFLHAGRLVRWRGLAIWRHVDLVTLHLAYGFIPFGFLAGALIAGADRVAGFPLGTGLTVTAAATHAWMAGALGVFAIAIPARAIGAHWGRPGLECAWPTGSAVMLAAIASLMRVLGASHWQLAQVGQLSAIPWIAAHLLLLCLIMMTLALPVWVAKVNGAGGQAVKSRRRQR